MDKKIVFSGESDEAPGMEPGDIIFVLIEKKHDVFKRNGNDLYMETTIPLIEALAGYAFTVKHLDDRTLLVKSEKGEVVTPGEVKMIGGEGMPKHKSPFEKGNLYIQFTIEFPKPQALKEPQLQQLEKLLPPRRPIPKASTDFEEVTPTKVVAEQKSRPDGRRRAPSDEEDDDEGQGGQRVQCAQQ